ncbi:hypothetical protein ACW5F0_10925 [Luteimonas sp. A534]
MSNPHPVEATTIDIRASADAVIELLQTGRAVEALERLERDRAGERPVVQEALDRYVAAGAREELTRLGGLEMAETMSASSAVLDRLQQATAAPRKPDYDARDAAQPNELVGLTDAQTYDVYASMVAARGSTAARAALDDGDAVLLGLRAETHTLASADAHARRGTGVYDDHIVVLRKGPDGERNWFIADRASTEPTAQYDHHAGSDGTRAFGDGGRERRDLDPSPGYEDVSRRKIEGEDVNADSYRDLGRLAEGSIEMLRTTHPARGRATDFSLRPTLAQIDDPASATLVERDTNADGWFDAADVNGVQALNNTFKIHSGSRRNTDSAGCQTIHPEDYDRFIREVTANPEQDRWQYVLTSTAGEPAREVELAGVHPAVFGDPMADGYLAAVMAGDTEQVDRIAVEFARSDEGRWLAQAGDRELAQDRLQAGQQREAQALAPREPALQM